MGFRISDFGFRISGTALRRTGWNDQCARARASRSNADPVFAPVVASSGHGAPPFTQAMSVAMSASGSFPFCGILMSPS